MDAHGVRMQLLSVSSGIDFLSPEESVEWCRKANDYLYEGMRKYPGRFQGFAALPVADLDASLQELEPVHEGAGLSGLDGRFQLRLPPILTTTATSRC